MPREFPSGFRWGTATAAHQVEGNNVNNDWWEWEHRPNSVCVEPSGDAVDHYHRYPSDIALMAALGFNNYRFSVEWSRIEPERGQYSQAAIDHYRRMCAACAEHGLDATVTFHHFTSPLWVSRDGGWLNPATVDHFARFSDFVAHELGDLVTRVCTINEPGVVAFVGYGLGIFPPGMQSETEWLHVRDNLLAAHRKAYEAIKSRRRDLPTGITLSVADYQAVPEDDPAAIARRDRLRADLEDVFLEACRGDDFVGVQNYTRHRVGAEHELGPEPGIPITAMGYELWPHALAVCVRRAWSVTEHVPILITENGVGSDDDDQRIAYLAVALRGVLDCLDEGIDVRGYTYWSFLDNFEWVFGYRPRFGVVEVDRTTQMRTVKPSGHWLSNVMRTGRLPEA